MKLNHAYYGLIMNKFSLDYSNLNQNLNREKYFKLKDVKDRLQKVAFDVVRFIDSDGTGDNIDGLWQIRTNKDGEYIVAMYEEEIEKTASSKKNDWTAMPDRSGSNINIFYKDEPIKIISIASLGIPASDAGIVSQSIVNKLATDELFFNSFVKELTASEKQKLDNKDKKEPCKACDTNKGEHVSGCRKQ